MPALIYAICLAGIDISVFHRMDSSAIEHTFARTFDAGIDKPCIDIPRRSQRTLYAQFVAYAVVSTELPIEDESKILLDIEVYAARPSGAPYWADLPRALVHTKTQAKGIVEAKKVGFDDGEFEFFSDAAGDLGLESEAQAPEIARDDVEVDAGFFWVFDGHGHHGRKDFGVPDLLAYVFAKEDGVGVSGLDGCAVAQDVFARGGVQFIQKEWKRFIGQEDIVGEVADCADHGIFGIVCGRGVLFCEDAFGQAPIVFAEASVGRVMREGARGFHGEKIWRRRHLGGHQVGHRRSILRLIFLGWCNLVARFVVVFLAFYCIAIF